MDEAINQTLIRCPDYLNANSTIHKLYNPLTFSDPYQLAEIACEASRLPPFGTYLIRTYYYKILITAGVIGMISSILSLLSYSLKEFSAKVFYYYRMINFLDLLYMATRIVAGSGVLNLGTSRQSKFVVEAYQYFVRFTAKSAHLMVLWLAFDRALGVSAVPWYRNMEDKSFVIRVIAGIMTFALLYDIPLTYFDLQVKYFNGTSPEAVLAVISRVLTAVEGISMLVCMCVVILGFVRMSKRKRRLMGLGNRKSQEEKETIKEIRRNQSLCALQICEGFPFLYTVIAVYLSYLTNFLMVSRDNVDTVIPGGTYQENWRHRLLYVIQTYFRYIVITMADVYSHGFHFYNYLAFSPKFRRTVIAYVRENRIGSIFGSQTVPPQIT